MIFTFRLSNSGLIFAMYPSSVVQTGVKSLGCEKSTVHESPIQSWNEISPSACFSAVKSGAVSLMVRLIRDLLRGASPLFGCANLDRVRITLFYDTAERASTRHCSEARGVPRK